MIQYAMRFWLCIVITLFSCNVNAEPFVMMDNLEYRPLLNSQAASADNTPWQALVSNQNIPQTHNYFQLRGAIELDESFSPPTGLFINLLGSYTATWDGVELGNNGWPNSSFEGEVAGQIDQIFLIPDHLKQPGLHTLTLTVSTHRLPMSQTPTFAWVFAANYDMLAKLGLKRAIVPLAMSGATLIVFIYLAYLFYSLNNAPKYLLFSALFSLSLLLLMAVESWRGIVGYPYQWHHWRLAAVTGLTLFASYVMLQFIVYFFTFTGRVNWLCSLVFGVVCVFAMLFVSSSDITSLLFILTSSGLCLFTAALACYQGKPQARLLLVVLLLFIAPASLGLLDFTDRYFFVSSGGLLAFLLYAQGRALKYSEVQLAESELSKMRLELELVKRNIQPHFILNTLTAVEEWIEESPKQAILFIQALAQEFRQIARLSSQPIIPLADEIALCKSHIAVMEYRTANNFVLQQDIENTCIGIPPGVLLTLVENGISHFPKHNAQTTFTITQTTTNKVVDITFSSECNVGQEGNDSTALGTGMGTQYIFARMTEAYQSKWHHKVEQHEGLWRFTLQFPVEDKNGELS